MLLTLVCTSVDFTRSYIDSHMTYYFMQRLYRVTDGAETARTARVTRVER